MGIVMWFQNEMKILLYPDTNKRCERIDTEYLNSSGYSSTKLRISEVNSILFWDHTKSAQSVSSSVSYYTMEILK